MTAEPLKFTGVEFPSQGFKTRGRLYLPETIEGPYSIVIIGPFTAAIQGIVQIIMGKN